MINLMNSASAKGCISCPGSFSCNCRPTATKAIGTIVLPNINSTFEIVSGKGVPIKKSAMINETNGGKVRILTAMLFRVISLLFE